MSGANRKSPCLIFTLICSFVQTAFLLSVGIIFLAFPIPAQNLLYPCLSKIEEKSDALLPVNVLEGDAIRLAGACFLAIAISSVGLLAICNLPFRRWGICWTWSSGFDLFKTLRISYLSEMTSDIVRYWSYIIIKANLKQKFFKRKLFPDRQLFFVMLFRW